MLLTLGGSAVVDTVQTGTIIGGAPFSIVILLMIVNTIRRLLKSADATARDFLRAKEPLAKELGLTEPGAKAADIIAAMVEHPVLVERPIVATAKGVRLGRPVEKVLEVL